LLDSLLQESSQMSCQQLNIQTYEADHSARLCSTVMAWTEKEADMYLVPEEGGKVYTHRNLISLYSSMVSDILKNTSPAMVGISVPVSSGSLVKLLKVLTGGTVTAAEKSDLADVVRAGEILGVRLQNIYIEAEKRSLEKKIKLDKSKMNVLQVIANHAVLSADQIDLNQRENSDEFLIDGSAEVDYLDEGSNILEVSFSEVTNSPMKIEYEKKRNFPKVSGKVICKVCGQNFFKNETGLSMHMKLKHKEQKPNTFKCHRSDKCFTNPVSQVSHKLIPTISKPYECEFCDYAATQKGSLKTHRLIHTIGRPYECEFCNYAATQKGNLKTHRLRKHKDSV